MAQNPYDLIVIGAGPGGYVAAIRAAQLGMHVVCVEKQYIGGVCLNIGCIPSKALLDSSHRFHDAKTKFASHGIKFEGLSLDLMAMLGRKDQVVKQLTNGVKYLLKKNKIDSIIGTAKITGKGSVDVQTAEGVQKLTAPRILIATGSVPIELNGLPYDGKYVVTSTEALAFPEVPKKLIVIGGGYIGLEMGSVWSRLGSEVLVIEFTEGVLPLMDSELATMLYRMLEKQGMKFQFKTGATKATVENGKVRVVWKSGDTTGEEVADRVLVATGRKPLTTGLGLESVGVAVDRRAVSSRLIRTMPPMSTASMRSATWWAG